jgi:hypothetical protein
LIEFLRLLLEPLENIRLKDLLPQGRASAKGQEHAWRLRKVEP